MEQRFARHLTPTSTLCASARSRTLRHLGTLPSLLNTAGPLQPQLGTAGVKAAETAQQQGDVVPIQDSGEPEIDHVKQNEQCSTIAAKPGAVSHSRNKTSHKASYVSRGRERRGGVDARAWHKLRLQYDEKNEALKSANKKLESVQRAKDRQIRELELRILENNESAAALSAPSAVDNNSRPPVPPDRADKRARSPPAVETENQLRKLLELQQRLSRLEQSIAAGKYTTSHETSELPRLLPQRSVNLHEPETAHEGDGLIRFLRFLSQKMQNNTTNLNLRLNALATHRSASLDPKMLCIYTDGTIRGDCVAAAAVVLSQCNIRVKMLPENPNDKIFEELRRSNGEGPFASLAETDAMLLALRSALVCARPGQTVVIFTDSISHLNPATHELNLLRGYVSPRAPEMVTMLKSLHERSIKVETSWIPKDCGMPGNLAAHLACRQACDDMLRGEEQVWTDDVDPAEP